MGFAWHGAGYLKLFEGGAAVAVFSSAVVPPLRAIYMALLTRCKMTVHLAFVIELFAPWSDRYPSELALTRLYTIASYVAPKADALPYFNLECSSSELSSRSAARWFRGRRRPLYMSRCLQACAAPLFGSWSWLQFPATDGADCCAHLPYWRPAMIRRHVCHAHAQSSI